MRFQSVARGFAAIIAMPVLASGCAFLIPENPSEPRYNTVLGERRVPQENAKSTGMGGASGSMAAPVAPVQQQPMIQQAPMQPAPTPVTSAAAPVPAPVATMDLPPVDANTQRLAAERMQQQQQNPSLSGRAVPSENGQPNNNTYPQLNQIPPAPPKAGPDSDAARLAAVRAELERDRNAAGTTSSQVRSAAAAEPSMLPPPAGMAPAPKPAYTPPAPIPYTQAPPVNVPPSANVRGNIATLPPPPVPYNAPVPAPVATPMASAPAPIQMDAIPMRAVSSMPAPAPAAIEPIMLRPPVVAAPAPQFAPKPANTASPAYNSMLPAAGSFDPMAGASYGSATASNGYLPASRYSGYRR